MTLQFSLPYWIANSLKLRGFKSKQIVGGWTYSIDRSKLYLKTMVNNQKGQNILGVWRSRYIWNVWRIPTFHAERHGKLVPDTGYGNVWNTMSDYHPTTPSWNTCSCYDWYKVGPKLPMWCKFSHRDAVIHCRPSQPSQACSTVAQMPFVVHPWLWMLRKAVQGCGLSGCNMIPKWCQDAVMLSNCFTLLYHVFVQHTVFGFKKLNSSNDSSLMEEKLRDLLAQPLLWHMLQIFADDFKIL